MTDGEFEVNVLHFDEPGNLNPVIRLEASQTTRLTHVLSRALHDDPRFTYVIPDERERRAVLPQFLSSVIRVALLHGENYTTPTIDGGALWLGPGHTTNIPGIVRNGLLSTHFKLSRASLRRCVRVAASLERVRQELVRNTHWFLMALGVEPSRRGRAIRSALIRPVLYRADSNGLLCYVEAFAEQNISFYEEHGFRIEGSGRISESGPEFWAMLRAPRS